MMDNRVFEVQRFGEMLKSALPFCDGYEVTTKHILIDVAEEKLRVISMSKMTMMVQETQVKSHDHQDIKGSGGDLWGMNGCQHQFAMKVDDAKKIIKDAGASKSVACAFNEGEMLWAVGSGFGGFSGNTNSIKQDGVVFPMWDKIIRKKIGSGVRISRETAIDFFAALSQAAKSAYFPKARLEYTTELGRLSATIFDKNNGEDIQGSLTVNTNERYDGASKVPFIVGVNVNDAAKICRNLRGEFVTIEPDGEAAIMFHGDDGVAASMPTYLKGEL